MVQNKTSIVVIMTLIILSMFIFGCTITEKGVPTNEPPPATMAVPTQTSIIQPTALPVESTEPVQEPALEPLPPQPQMIEFIAEDGYALKGTYYPAAVNPAPMVVLFHQAGFNQDMWQSIAPWLQNRAVEMSALQGTSGGVLARPLYQAYIDPAWFPEVPQDLQVGVFTFTYRCWESGSCGNYDRQGWLKDAQAAINTASELPGVDSQRIITAGTSIGADGAADACYLYNQSMGSGCLGAASFSPASYLTMDYKDTAEKMLDGQLKILCAASEGDRECSKTCNSLAEQAGYQKIIYPGSAHGIYMVDPSLEPSLLDNFLVFLLDLTI